MWDRLLSGHVLWFTVPALLGLVAIGLRVLWMLIAGVDAVDCAGASVVEASPDKGDEGHEALAALSLPGLSAFLAGFGWAGLGTLLGLGWELAPSAAVGVAGGVTTVWLMGLLR